MYYGKWNIQIIETIDSRPATTDSQHQDLKKKKKFKERIKYIWQNVHSSFKCDKP